MDPSFKSALKEYARIFKKAAHDKLNEADTVMRFTRFCEDVLGYSLEEITREQAIKGTYVDVALKVGDETRILIEVKAAGANLRESYTQQAQNYSANQGISWVVLTNGTRFILYRVELDGAIEANEVFDVDLAEGNLDQGAELLYMLHRKPMKKGTELEKYYQLQRALSPAMILKALSSETVVTALRRELKHVTGHRVSDEDAFEALKAIIREDSVSNVSSLRIRRTPKPISQEAETEGGSGRPDKALIRA